MLVLAFDTVTSVATAALLDGAKVLGERRTAAKRLLVDVDEIVRAAGAAPTDLDGVVVGVGPGSFTSTRIGLAVARGLALALDVPVAGVSTLDALAAGTPGALPVIDARRREVFVPGPAAISPDALVIPPGTTCVGDGAVRYRDAIEVRGGHVPPDDSDAHVPWARLHAGLARSFGPADAVLPVYVRVPDADRVLA